MATFYVRSRPTANWSTGAKTLGQKVVATSAVAFLGICFEVTTAGTSSGSEPSWNSTIGGTTTDGGGVVWTTRGAAGIWQASKNYALGDRVVPTAAAVGTMNSAATCVWECTTAGASNSTEPSWPTTITAGTTTKTDNTVTWTARACTTWDNANPYFQGLLKDTSNSTIKVSAGDTIYASKYHNESTSNGAFTHYVIGLPGTRPLPSQMFSADDTGQPTPPTSLVAGATVTNNASSFCELRLEGFFYCEGFTFIHAGTSSGNSSIYLGGSSGAFNSSGIFKNCKFTLSGNNGAGLLAFTGIGGSNSKCIWINCTVKFANNSQTMYRGVGEFYWRNDSGIAAIDSGGTIPTNLFFGNTGGALAGSVTLDGLDLTPLASNTLFSQYDYFVPSPTFVSNCKISGSTTRWGSSSTVSGFGTSIADFINCDSGSSNNNWHRYMGSGEVSTETTKIMSAGSVATSGANDGTNGFSHKMVSNANAQWLFPLEGFSLPVWVDTTGSSKTATVEILTDSVSALNNDDVWLEIEYLGDSGDPIGLYANNTKSSYIASNAAQPTSSATWTTTGITNVMKQKLQVSFTPQQKGYVRGVVKLGKASTTVYYDAQMVAA